MLLITALTDEEIPPLLWLLLLDFCLRSWSSSEAFSLHVLRVKKLEFLMLVETVVLCDFGRVQYKYVMQLLSSTGSAEGAVQQKPLAGQKHLVVTQSNLASKNGS